MAANHSLTFAPSRRYSYFAGDIHRSELAFRKTGGQPPQSGFFTSVIHDTLFMGGSCGESKDSPVLSRYANLHESAHPIGVGEAEKLNRIDRSHK